MNGAFLASIIRAVGYAAFGEGSDEESATPERPAARRANPYARKKGCCNAKRSEGAASAAPVHGAQFSGVRRVRKGGE